MWLICICNLPYLKWIFDKRVKTITSLKTSSGNQVIKPEFWWNSGGGGSPYWVPQCYGLVLHNAIYKISSLHNLCTHIAKANIVNNKVMHATTQPRNNYALQQNPHSTLAPRSLTRHTHTLELDTCARVCRSTTFHLMHSRSITIIYAQQVYHNSQLY